MKRLSNGSHWDPVEWQGGLAVHVSSVGDHKGFIEPERKAVFANKV